ncbi:MAG TPA: cytochrome c [Thermoanaerobaculia bacterium]|nr:cytochrome c [Thermoanaerobaculia bacterium]
MHHPRVPIGFYLVAAALVLTALLIAWTRSRSATVTAGPASAAANQVTAVDPRRLGAEVYASHCSSCHRQGERRGRSIPPLQGFAVELLVAEGGREYLVDFLFDGRVRRVADGEVTWVESHPEFGALSDQEAAAVLNHMLTSWGNAELLGEDDVPYTASEVAARR